MASMLSLCCSRGPSGSMPLSRLQSELSPLLSPFTSTTSQWLLDASVLHDDSDVIASPDAGRTVAAAVAVALASASGCGSASPLAAPSRFSLLLDSRCLLPSWGRRRRPGRRLPLLFGLPDGLLVRLRDGADFLLEAGDAVEETEVRDTPHTPSAPLPVRDNKRYHTFVEVAEAGGG